jgi:PAS domain S-box-containing protein
MSRTDTFMTDASEQRRLDRLRLLQVMDSDVEPVFEALVRMAAALCGKPIALISLIDERRQWFKANLGLEGFTETPRDIAFCAHAIAQEGVMEVADARTDARFAGNPLVTGDPGIRFYAGAPITMPSGERIGTVCVIDHQPGTLSADQKRTLQDLASVVEWVLLKRERLNAIREVGNETEFAAISYANPMGVFQTDHTGAIFHASGRWEAIMGTDVERAMGSGWQDAIHRRDREEVIGAWQYAVTEFTSFDLDFRVCGPGRNWQTHVRMQARPATWGDPPRRGFVGAIADISERKEVERQLRSANNFLERAERLSGVGGWESDLKNRSVKWTDQNCRIYELEPGHQPGFDEHLRYFSPEVQEQIAQFGRRALQSGQPWDVELPMTTARGRPVWVRSVGLAEFEHGQPVRLAGALQDVTEQKAAQDQVRAVNTLLTSVIDNLPCGLSVFDGDLRLVAHNRQFRELQQFPDALFRGPVVSFESLIRYNALQGEYGNGPAEELVRGIVEQARKVEPHHLQRTRRNGVTLDIRGGPLPGGGFVTTYVDVSPARAAEEALRESQERQKRALDASRLALWDIDFTTGNAYMSENWSVMMGEPRRAIVTTSHHLAEQVPESDRGRIQAALLAMVKGTSDRYEIEHEVRRPDGGMIWVHSQGRIVLRDAAGRALRATGTNQDITARKQAEEQLARAAAITAATLESTADGIIVVSMQREILLYNRKFLSMWNISPELENAPHAQILAHVHKQVADRDYANQVQALYDGPATENSDVLQLVDGRVFERYSRPMDVDGTALGRVWSFRDVTEKYHADAQIKQAKEQAEAASIAKSEFLNTVSHEIRTPLNGVLGMTQLMLSGELSSEQRRYAELTHSSAQSLLALINDTLDLGKIESGRMEFEHVEFDVLELARELGDMYRLQAQEKHVGFELELDLKVPARVVGDPGRLRQILNNLLGNALKFTEAGLIGLDVHLGPPARDRLMLGFTVHDTGIGIPVEVQPQLFQRFSQADSSTTRQYGGTGLGLAIVKQLCEQMGGRVTLLSEAGRGASFRCELPFARAATPTERVAPVAGGPPASREPRPQRILVAEDNATNQIVVQGMLGIAGYANVRMVADGQQVLDAVAGAKFDAILMDCRMPVMDGYAATTQLRAAGCQIPIIALTANVSDEERQKCLAVGMNDFLSKPMEVAQLAQVLDRWTAPAQEEVDGRQKALDRMDGDAGLFAMVLESFFSLAPKTLVEVETALAAADVQAVHRYLHSLAGSSAMVGAERLARLARELEEQALAGRLVDVGGGLPRLQVALNQFVRSSAAG